jgi:hypothetical protein
MKRALLFVLSTIVFYPIHAIAGTTGYNCVVLQELHLDENGLLKPYPNPLELGKKFSVSRTTGALVEQNASFWSPRDAKIFLHAVGNSENSFIVGYVAPSGGGGAHVTQLRIEEFTKGKVKPFMLTSGASVYSGTCE